MFLPALQFFCLLVFTQQQQSDVYHVGRGITPPVPIYRVEPEFSELAREANFEGTVLLKAIVGADGLIQEPSIVKPVGMGLDEAALAALQQWRFKPGKKDGEPVRVYVQVEITFRLLSGVNARREPNDSAWMAAASTSDKPFDQASVGKVFYWGIGVARDFDQALVFFQRAAAQDDARSEAYLGLMYSQGQGVVKDDAVAASWFRKAAEQNDEIGQLYLGKAYVEGAGVPVDFVQAHLWFSLAIQGRGQEAQARYLREQIAAKMSASEIASAELLAQNWKPRK